MKPHHQKCINKINSEFESDNSVLCLLLTGSIAHGTATEQSDIDITIIVDDIEFDERLIEKRLNYWKDLSDEYKGGYIDGKYTNMAFLENVASKGSEPARYAFLDSMVLFDKTNKVPSLIKDIVRYPTENKDENLQRFYAQFEAWHWYCEQALKKGDAYLLNHSISNMILFGGRIILAINEVLYPYHKWLIATLKKLQNRPPALMDAIDVLLEKKGKAEIHQFYECIKQMLNDNSFISDDNDNWPHQFMLDSELNWLGGDAPVADV